MNPKEELNSIFLKCYDSDIQVTKNICPVCEFEIFDTQKYFKIDNSMWGENKIVRIKCPKCDSVYGSLSLMNMIPEKLDNCYKLLYSFFKEGTTQLSQNDIFFNLQPEKNKKYINYGCGDWGVGIQKLLSLGYDVFGYDSVIDSKKERIFTKISEINTKFDGLFSQNFIEHIQNPTKQFIEWNSMLNIGSKMIHVGDYNYDESVKGTNFHLIFLSENGLKILSERTGFELISKINRTAIFKKIKDIEYE